MFKGSSYQWRIFLVILILSVVLSGCGKLTDDVINKDPKDYSVSGLVANQAQQGIADVTLTFSGVASTATTAGDGKWTKFGLVGSVTVTPGKTGWSFTPASRQVTGVATDIDFTGIPDVSNEKSTLAIGDNASYNVYEAMWFYGDQEIPIGAGSYAWSVTNLSDQIVTIQEQFSREEALLTTPNLVSTWERSTRSNLGYGFETPTTTLSTDVQSPFWIPTSTQIGYVVSVAGQDFTVERQVTLAEVEAPAWELKAQGPENEQLTLWYHTETGLLLAAECSIKVDWQTYKTKLQLDTMQVGEVSLSGSTAPASFSTGSSLALVATLPTLSPQGIGTASFNFTPTGGEVVITPTYREKQVIGGSSTGWSQWNAGFSKALADADTSTGLIKLELKGKAGPGSGSAAAAPAGMLTDYIAVIGCPDEDAIVAVSFNFDYKVSANFDGAANFFQWVPVGIGSGEAAVFARAGIGGQTADEVDILPKTQAHWLFSSPESRQGSMSVGDAPILGPGVYPLTLIVGAAMELQGLGVGKMDGELTAEITLNNITVRNHSALDVIRFTPGMQLPTPDCDDDEEPPPPCPVQAWSAGLTTIMPSLDQ